MKKVFLGVLAMCIALSVETVTVFAAGPCTGGNYVDADGDGICDYAHGNCIYADADNDGVCDNCGIYHWCGGNGAGCGQNYTDADGDGICDYAHGNCIYRDADGDGICDNYTDADENGICDNYAAGRGRRNGRGHGSHGGCGR